MTTQEYDTGFKVYGRQTDDRLRQAEQYRPWLPSPPKLKEYAGDLVNEKPLPVCWEWTVEEVENWFAETVGLPQYQDCIRRNRINGRRLLLLLETFGFPKCGITNFSHIQTISDSVRRLYGVERPQNDRSIGLPPRFPWTHYLLYRIPTGPTREATTPFVLFQQMGILDESEPCPFGHWEMIEPAWKTFPYNRFGLTTKKSVYREVELPRQPDGHSFLKKSKLRSNYYIRTDVQ